MITVWIPQSVSGLLQLDNTAKDREVRCGAVRRCGAGWREAVIGSAAALTRIAEECEDTAAGKLYDEPGVEALFPACRRTAARIRAAIAAAQGAP
jgi:hypothetical protein